MTWRMALDRQRANRRRSSRELGVEVDAPATGGESMEARERAEHLWVAIDALPDKLRIVVVLAGIEGHDMKEVAALLDVPEGTVKSRLFVARKQLREQLSWMAAKTR
jgi:RNA polymerase sigma-70 factor (ECF subfamily)